MESSDAIVALSALAQEARLGVFRLLVGAGEPGMGAGEIAAAMDLPANTLSFHLKELSRARLIAPERSGRQIRYSIKPDGIRDLLGFLTQDCCAGNPALCGGPNPSCSC
jgi:DNA-binding transcriptional ArsR family regulator